MLFTHHNEMTISTLGKHKSNTFIIKVRYIFQVFNYEHVEDYRTTFLNICKKHCIQEWKSDQSKLMQAKIIFTRWEIRYGLQIFKLTL